MIHALHKANVREFDDWFAEFWQFFCKSGLDRKTVLIVTADHGDEHGERGSVGHASTNGGGHLHGEIVRVPLFLWLPEKLQLKDYGKTFENSDHQDVMVTLFTLLDIPVPRLLKGRDLFGSTVKSGWAGMTSGGGFNEQDPNNIEYYEYGLIDDGWKLLWRIDSDGEQNNRLYKITDDPGETYNLADTEPLVMARLQNILQLKIDGAQHRPIHLLKKTLDSPSSAGPRWMFPVASGHYDYEDFKDGIYLQWQGDEEADYILQYEAGKGENLLEGTLEVHGLKKDFGKFSHRYWKTWIVPAGPVKVRVRRADQGKWSDWLIVEPLP